MIKILLSLYFVFLIGCSSNGPKTQQDHLNFMQAVEQNERSLSKIQFRDFLQKQISLKENHLAAVQKEYANAGELETLQQSAAHGSDDIQNMNLRSSQINLHNMNDKIQMLQKQIFFLKSKLSSLD